MKTTLLLVLLSATVTLWSQDVHRWSDGPLRWSQIDLKPLESPDQPDFRLGYNLEVLPVRQKITADSTVLRYKADGYLELQETWITAGRQTEFSLQFMQVALGCVERHRRGLQRALHGNNLRPVDIAMLQSSYMDRIASDLRNLLSQTELQSSPMWVADTLEAMAQEFREPLPMGKPRYQYVNANIGLTVMSGVATHLGPLKDYSHSPWLPFGFGFDFGWKRWSLFALGNFTRSSLNQALPVDPAWAAGRGTTGVILNVGVGYRLVQTRHWQLTPSVGWGVHEILLRNPADERESSLRQVDYGPTLALLIDYRFKTVSKSVERNDFFVRLRLLAGPGADTDPFRGWTFGGSIGVGTRSWIGKHLLGY